MSHALTSPSPALRFLQFSRFGDIGDIYIPRDHATRQSRGFAFVRFYNKHDAEARSSRLGGPG